MRSSSPATGCDRWAERRTVWGRPPPRNCWRPSRSPAPGRPTRPLGRGARPAARPAVDCPWGQASVKDRVDICERFCGLLEAHLEQIGVLWAHEAGMPVRYGKTLHRYGAVAAWRSALAVAEDTLQTSDRESPLGSVSVIREPAGVVLGILPYNGPLPSVATKVIPALLAGCAVIVKPAVESSFTMRVVAECAERAGFPAGALSILPAGLEVARQLSADPGVDLVSLTGGPAAAQDILRVTGPRLA